MPQAAAPDGEPLRVPPSGLKAKPGGRPRTAGRRRMLPARRAKVGELVSPSGRRAAPLRPCGALRGRLALAAVADPIAPADAERAALG